MKIVEVKNVRIGEGMPKICVPVTAANIENIKKQAKAAMMSPADLIELRADCLMNVRDSASLRVVIDVLRRETEGRPVLFTLRTSAEGGMITVSDDEYFRICGSAIDSGGIDLIDLEFSMTGSIRNALMKKASSRGVKVLMSFHDFNATPSGAELLNKLTDMRRAGADIVKAAVMPQNTDDVLTVMGVSSVLSKEENAAPVIAISMGFMGMVCRLSGEIFGSAVTFGTAGASSAPGQIDADELDRIMRAIHDSAENRSESAKMHFSPKKKNIVLVGFMGAGKTTTAELIGEKTGYKVVETDDEIADSEGMPIPDIFDRYGEEYFRNIESKLIQRLSERSGSDPAVISCGGGTVMRPENVKALRGGGVIILLKAAPDTVYERVKRAPSSRPLLSRYMSRGYISWLMKQRDAAYTAAADYIVSVDGKSSEQVAEEILALMTV